MALVCEGWRCRGRSAEGVSREHVRVSRRGKVVVTKVLGLCVAPCPMNLVPHPECTAMSPVCALQITTSTRPTRH